MAESTLTRQQITSHHALRLLCSWYREIWPAYYAIVDAPGTPYLTGITKRTPTALSEFAASKSLYAGLEALEFRQSEAYFQTGRRLTVCDIRLAFRALAGESLAVPMLKVNAKRDLAAHLLIEIAPGEWQGHFKLSRPCTADEWEQVSEAVKKSFRSKSASALYTVGAFLPTSTMACYTTDAPPVWVDAILSGADEFADMSRAAHLTAEDLCPTRSSRRV